MATATGTITLEATFANGDERLWPNEFVSVRLTEYVLRNSITIPSTALLTGPTGQYVYTIGADHKVKRADVTVVATQQGTAIVGKGLTAGEEVVTDGQYRLDDGVVVSIQRPATAAPAQASTAASAPSASMTPAARR